MTRRPIFFFTLSLLVILIDQWSKWFVLVNKIFPVYYNSNVGFSLPIPWYAPWLFLLGLLAYLFFSQSHSLRDFLENMLGDKPRLLYYALSFIIAGGLSNIIDRALHNGAVVDFIDLRYWPVFNIADISICLGGALLLFYYYKVTHKKAVEV